MAGQGNVRPLCQVSNPVQIDQGTSVRHCTPKPAPASSPRAGSANAGLYSGVVQPPSRGLEVRCFRTWKGEFAFEVWNQGRPVDPPPYLVARKDPTIEDCFYRVGDTIAVGSVAQYFLPNYGFADPGTSALTALLYFVADIDSDTDYQLLGTIQEIRPDLSNPWRGWVVFRTSLVTGGTILPCPRQMRTQWDFKLDVMWQLRNADELMKLAEAIEVYEEVLMDLAWALTGGWEVKAATEVTEKYVAREVTRRALKYMKPKFVAVAKAYIESFVKELAAQTFHHIVNMIQNAAADKIRMTPGADTITVEEIHWLQSSKQLSQATEKAKIDFGKCHTKGMEEALKPLWQLFAGSNVAKTSLYRFVSKCFRYIEQSFFDLGLRKEIEKAEGPIGKQVSKTIAEVTTDWMKEVTKSGKPVEVKASEQRVQTLTMSNLRDGTLVVMAKDYFEKNWEKMAGKAIAKAEDGFFEKIRGGAKAE